MSEKQRVYQGEGAIFAICFFVLLFVLGVGTSAAGLTFWYALLVSVIGSIVASGIIAHIASNRARARRSEGAS